MRPWIETARPFRDSKQRLDSRNPKNSFGVSPSPESTLWKCQPKCRPQTSHVAASHSYPYSQHKSSLGLGRKESARIVLSNTHSTKLFYKSRGGGKKHFLNQKPGVLSLGRSKNLDVEYLADSQNFVNVTMGIYKGCRASCT